MSLEAFRLMYRKLAIIVLNTLILIVVINLLLFAYFSFKDRSRDHWTISDQRWQLLERVYENSSRKEVQDLWDETLARPFVYSPYLEFKERPHAGKYIHVNAQGVREVNPQGPWPPDREKYFTVFLFGGSTTFGYGVPDAETISSYLQANLAEVAAGKEVRVYNFGCGYYYSTQERILFEQLISAGNKPDLAIFIDGLNDFWFYDDRPLYADKLELLFDGKLETPSAGFLNKLPMMRAASSLKQRLAPAPKSPPAASGSEYNDPTVLTHVIQRYANNKRMIDAIAAVEGVKTVFVWQPISIYKFDQSYNLFAADAFVDRAYARFGYPLMNEYARKNAFGDNFLWCADMQEGMHEPLYVDTMHYSSKMSKAFAKTIVEMMKNKTFLLEQKK